MKTRKMSTLVAAALVAVAATSGEAAAAEDRKALPPARSASYPPFVDELRQPRVVVPREKFRIVDDYGLTGDLESVAASLAPYRSRSSDCRRLRLCRGMVGKHESHRIDATPREVVLTAFDDDGIRRAVYRFESQLAANALESEVRSPWLRHRISRCVFGPIKRAPNFVDELMNDVDYYPEAYLDRLAHEGVNGLWLTVELSEVARTPYRAVDPSRSKRLEKLKATVARCRRYGIRTWIFCIEPKMPPIGDPFYSFCPEAFGASCDRGKRVMCPSHPLARAYFEESARSVFAAVPGLGGMIMITQGERATTCLSYGAVSADRPDFRCRRCNAREPWRVYSDVVSSFARGMRAANPDAELISWFYQPQADPRRGAWITSCARHVPEGVVFQYNFESGVEKSQLGKIRRGGDYWLSCEGPSVPFGRVAEAVRGCGGRLSAKIQVGCSHETATVPYVPAPGLLYRKYRKMRELGVESVMQCWYFGNYPGVMNRAAGELAFETFADDEQSFLDRLARPEWGGLAPDAARCWSALTAGYMHYPLSNQMQYYGPVHAGFTWPLFADIEMTVPGALTEGLPATAPAWLLVRQCVDRQNERFALWPADSGFDRKMLDARLNLGGIYSDCFGRLAVGGGVIGIDTHR